MIIDTYTLFDYLRKNKLIALVIIYILFSAYLKSITKIDICIPCIWNLLFGIHCYGCGLTTALINIMKLNFKAAFEINSLIFIIIPFSIFYIIYDYNKFNAKK